MADIKKRIAELEKGYLSGETDSRKRLEAIYNRSDSYLFKFLAGEALYGRDETEKSLEVWMKSVERELGIEIDFGMDGLRDIYVESAVERVADLRNLYNETGSARVLKTLGKAALNSDSGSVRMISGMDLIGCCVNGLLGRAACC